MPVWNPIPISELNLSVNTWWKNGVLLTAGDFAAGQFNTMTIAWGAFGEMWSMPMAVVMVRPSRYTYQFMEAHDTFTISAFPAGYQKALSLLGSRSGRDGDKIKAAGLTPTALPGAAAPAFAEANLALTCQKLHHMDLDPASITAESISSHYAKGDYHRFYFGKILGAYQNAA